MTNKSCLIPNGRAIVFNYPAGAGGKMLQNCVALSRHCVIKHEASARWELEYNLPIDSRYYEYKFRTIMQTLPPLNELHNWLRYEFGEQHLYGITAIDFNHRRPIANQNIYKIAERNLWTTITTHNWGAVEHYHNYWPTLKHVCLINNTNFSKRWIGIKNKNVIPDTDWPVMGCSPPGQCFEFDIDSTMFDEDRFIIEMKKLYDYLGFEDFQTNLIRLYYQHYINLHD